MYDRSFPGVVMYKGYTEVINNATTKLVLLHKQWAFFLVKPGVKSGI